MSEDDKTPDEPAFPTPEIPDALYAMWNTTQGDWGGEAFGMFDVSREAFNARYGWLPVKVGVNPALLEAANARIAELEGELYKRRRIDRPWLRGIPDPPEPQNGGDITANAYEQLEAFTAWLNEVGGDDHPLAELMQMTGDATDLIQLYSVFCNLIDGEYVPASETEAAR